MRRRQKILLILELVYMSANREVTGAERFVDARLQRSEKSDYYLLLLVALKSQRYFENISIFKSALNLLISWHGIHADLLPFSDWNCTFIFRHAFRT